MDKEGGPVATRKRVRGGRGYQIRRKPAAAEASGAPSEAPALPPRPSDVAPPLQPPKPPEQPEGEVEPREPYVRIERVRRAIEFARDRLRISRVEIPAALQRHGMHIVNAVLEPLFLLWQANAPGVGGLVFSEEYFLAQVEGGATAEYDPHEGTLFLNPHLTLWDADGRRRAHQTGVLSTPDLRGTCYHEYTHHWVFAHSPMDYTMLQTGMVLGLYGVSTDAFARVARFVSDYATDSPLEFLSEVYAALRTGFGVVPQALVLYTQLLLNAPPLD